MAREQDQYCLNGTEDETDHHSREHIGIGGRTCTVGQQHRQSEGQKSSEDCRYRCQEW